MKTFATLVALFSTLSFVLADDAGVSYSPNPRNYNVPGLTGSRLSANNGAFYIGRTPTGVCPDYDTDCNAKDSTWVSGPTGPNNNFWMAISNPSGQQMYVAKNGSLEYTAFESGFKVPDAWARQNGFTKADAKTVTDDYNTDVSPYLKWDEQDWYACPDGGAQGEYKVYAQSVVNSTLGQDYNYGNDCAFFHFRLDIHRFGSTGAVDHYN